MYNLINLDELNHLKATGIDISQKALEFAKLTQKD